MRQQDREIQGTKTAPDQHDGRWEDGHEAIQIKCDMHRGGREGMVMPLVSSLCLIEAIGVPQAHYRGHSEQTDNQCGEYLPGF